MPAPDRLPPQTWMTDPATQAVMSALEAAGGPGSARYVGGCVRNALIGEPVNDIDIATPLEPDAVIAALKAADLKFAPTGVEHGTVTAIAWGRPFEVTTLRRDVETDGRRAVVAFTTDWAQDAQRRDFRLNAIYMDAQGYLYDPVGLGVEDALAGRIVFVGDAETRIREDYLRILRFFRFRAWYGRGAIDTEGLAACAVLRQGLAQLPAERVSKELLKLLAAADPREAIELMDDTAVLEVVLPGDLDVRRFANLVGLERELLDERDAALRLAALLPSEGQTVAGHADRLRLSRAQRERLVAAASNDPLTAALSPAAARRLIYREGADTFADRARLAWAGRADPWAEARAWRALLSATAAWRPPVFPLTGQDAAMAGIPPGPRMGQALRAAEDWWVQEDFRPSRAELISRLKP